MKPRKSSVQIASALMVLCATPFIFADPLTWDAGVDSDWNTTTANWTGDTWDNTFPDDAIFGVTGEGTVTATEAITAGSVTFTGGAYNFTSSGGGSLSFSTWDTAGATSVGYNGVLSGSGTITSNVGGTWTGNNSAFNGIVNHSAGTIAVGSANGLGTGTLNLSGGVLTLSTSGANVNGSLLINATGGQISSSFIGTNGFLGTVNFNSGGSGVTLGGQVTNRLMAFRTGSTFGGNASNINIARSFVFIEEGVNWTYTGGISIVKSVNGNPSVLNLGNGLDLSANEINFQDAVNWNPQIQSAANASVTIGDVVVRRSNDNGTASLNTAIGSTLTVDGVISGAGGFNKAGAGTVVLTDTNTYSGITNANEGTLLVNGNSSGATGAVNVAAGATLGGTGSIGGAINVTGQLAPGASIESLSGAALSFLDTSEFAVEVDSSVSLGVGADLMVVNGNLSLTGTVNLTLANIATSPLVFADGTTFSLINYSGNWNGGLFTYGGDALGDGETFAFNSQTWQIDYGAASGGSNFTGDHLSGSFVNITAIPEPGGTVGILAGLLVFTTLVRRRRS